MGMQPLLRVLLLLWLGLAGVAQAEDKAAALREALLSMAGTAHIFDSPRVQAAVADAQAYQQSFGRGFDQRRLERVLRDAGFRVWRERPRLWALQARDGGWVSLAEQERFMREAQRRGLPVVAFSPGEAVAPVLKSVQAGDETALPGLLKANDADALLLLRPAPGGRASWQFLQPGRRLEGVLDGAEPDVLLPHVLSERLAAHAQWPEADGRSLLRLGNVRSMDEFMAAQAALAQLSGLKGLSLVRLDGRQAYFAFDSFSPAALVAEPQFKPEPQVSLPVLWRQGLQQGSLLHSRTWVPAAPSVLP